MFWTILIIIIAVLFLVTTDNKEHFDAMYTGFTDTTCGDKCTKTYGCAGYAFDSATGKCYLSKTAILGRPFGSLYTSAYSASMPRCSKKYNIDSPTEPYTTQMKIDNASYLCSSAEGGTPTEKIIVNGLNDLSKNLSSNTSISDYTMASMQWPTTRASTTSATSATTATTATTATSATTATNATSAYTLLSGYYSGDFLNAPQCSTNTDVNTCLNSCSGDTNCAGDVWIPSYVQNGTTYSKVCCPMKNIGSSVTAPSTLTNAQFYKKINN